MKLKLFCIFFILACNACYAERFIIPTKYDYQEEILVNGGSMLVSDKSNSVLMYQISETVKNRCANFYFVITNKSEKPINFYHCNLRVTDQWGRPVRVISKKSQLARKRKAFNWQMLGAALCASSDIANAQQAGTIHYQAHTHEHYNTNYNLYGSQGRSHGHVAECGDTYTHGTFHCEALRQQAVRQAEIDSCYREAAIGAAYQGWVYGLNNYYFDSNTLFPNQPYGANFQIEVPDEIERNLQYLVFTYDLGGEEHSFCFYTGFEKKHWFSR